MSYVDEYLEGGSFLVLNHLDQPVGSGFLIGNNLALTCEHLLARPYHERRPERVSVQFSDEIIRRFDVGERVGSDIAVLSCDVGLQPLGLGHFIATDLNEEARLRVVGCAPNGQLKTEFSGHLTRFGSGDRRRRMISFDSGQIGPGFSGGPVLDSWTGQVVGMIVGGDEVSPEGRYGKAVFAVPTQLILDEVGQASLIAGPVLTRYQHRILGSKFGDRLGEFVPPRISLASSGITSPAEITLKDLLLHKSIIGINGPSGLGKSTLLAHLACEYSRDESLGTLPILFSLHNALKSSQTGERARMLDAARHDETFHRAGLWEDKENFDPLLLCSSLDRTAVFLVDGVDEALRDMSRPGGLPLLEDLISIIRSWGNGAIISARDPRTVSMGNAQKNVAMPWYELLGFDEAGQRKFISRFPKLTPGTHAYSKFSRLPKGILERPLLLKLAAEVLTDEDDVGSVKSLYSKFIVNEIARAIGTDRQRQIILLRLLQALALRTWRNIDESALETYQELLIETVSGALSIDAILCEAVLLDGLDNLSKARTLLWNRNGRIRWAHSSFQEFLAAQAWVLRTKRPTHEIVFDLVKEEQNVIDVAAFVAALLPSDAQETLLKNVMNGRPSRVLRGIVARAISFGLVTTKYQLAVAEGLLDDLRAQCKGPNACDLLWTSYAGETCWELERLLDVGGEATEAVLMGAINRPMESLILLQLYIAVLGKMGAWKTLRKLVCDRGIDIRIRIICLSTLLDNSELSILTECAEGKPDDHIAPFIWDALRKTIGQEKARALAKRCGAQPIELEDLDFVHDALFRNASRFKTFARPLWTRRCLIRIASEKPELLLSPDLDFISETNLECVQRAFEVRDYTEEPQCPYVPEEALEQFRLREVILPDDSASARAGLIGVAITQHMDDVTKVLAVSTLCNLGAIRALNVISNHASVTLPVRAAAHERLTREWTLWANRVYIGVENECTVG